MGSAWARKRGEATERRVGRGGAWPSDFVGGGVGSPPDVAAASAELEISRGI